jgi:hypothetical protein
MTKFGAADAFLRVQLSNYEIEHFQFLCCGWQPRRVFGWAPASIVDYGRYQVIPPTGQSFRGQDSSCHVLVWRGHV